MVRIRRTAALLYALATLTPSLAAGAVERRQFTSAAGYLVVEVLDDDLVHFEASAIGTAPPSAQPLYTSPMVLKKDYGGPSVFTDGGLTLETPAMRLVVEASSLCVRVEDRTRGNAHLTTICPRDMERPFKGLDLEPAGMTQVYGLGQQFTGAQNANSPLVQASA